MSLLLPGYRQFACHLQHTGLQEKSNSVQNIFEESYFSCNLESCQWPCKVCTKKQQKLIMNYNKIKIRPFKWFFLLHNPYVLFVIYIFRCLLCLYLWCYFATCLMAFIYNQPLILQKILYILYNCIFLLILLYIELRKIYFI